MAHGLEPCSLNQERAALPPKPSNPNPQPPIHPPSGFDQIDFRFPGRGEFASASREMSNTSPGFGQRCGLVDA